MPRETPTKSSALRSVGLATALVVLTVLAFQGLRHNAFVNFDDPALITQNLHVRAGLGWSGVQWAFTTDYFAIWHPLTWLSLMADASLFGLNPAGHHLMALLIHVLNTLLVFAALQRMTGVAWRSAMVAALFAIHPLHVESVAWAAERKDVLYTLFWFAAILAYSRYTDRPTIARYSLVLVMAACSLMAKPMAVTLPCVLLLLDYWPLGRFKRDESGDTAPQRRLFLLVGEKVPLFAMSMACSIVTYIVSKDQGASKTLEQYPLLIRAENVLLSYVTYLGKMLWPVDLAVHYPFASSELTPATAMAVAAVLAVITALAVYFMRSRPYVLVGWLWYLGALVPAIGIVQVGHRAMADRFTYVPLVGVFVALVWLLADCARERPRVRVAMSMCALVLLALLSARTADQVSVWRNSRTLFTQAVRVSPQSVAALNNLGLALMEAGDLTGAQANFEAAIKLDSEGAIAVINLGIVKGLRGDMPGAAEELKRAVRISPNDANAHFNLALALEGIGNRLEAAQHFAEALRLRPSFREAQDRLSALNAQ
ncbi:MAG: tetratricopeptide repeat protein [Candidatus Hydrogenedentales bacterium]|jgi:tetratricopeptide (TPR) repeat protein